MKRIFTFLIVGLFVFGSQHAFTQIIDLSTGIDNNGDTIPIGTNDDTWTVCLPGNNYTVAGSYQPVQCGTGRPDGYNAYVGKDPSVRWLSPDLNSSGDHLSTSVQGYYYYKMTFENECEIESASMCFDHIGADNYIDQVIINNNIHSVNYGFNPFANDVCLTPAPDASEFYMGINEVIIRVYNAASSSTSGSFTGMEIKGELLLFNNSVTDASFCAFTNSTGGVFATPSTSGGNHTWEVYASPTGSPGTFQYLNTVYNEELNLGGGEPCYYIKHTVEGECGLGCTAQSICYQSCNDELCHISAPQNLAVDFSTNTLSWDPVPGATSYVIEIIINAPGCCRPNYSGTGLSTAPMSITVSGTSHTLDFVADLNMELLHACYAWRVYAVCGSESVSPASQTFCTSTGGVIFSKVGKTTDPLVPERESAVLNIFPNPTKGSVSFDVTTANDHVFSIMVFDTQGKMVRTFENVQPEKNKATTVKWDTGSLAKGTYVIRVISADGIASENLVIE